MIYIHHITPSSVVNGPFQRTVVHFQGCTLACPGCFNSATHPMHDGMNLSVNDILSQLPAEQKHITISGGEPFLQIKGLLALVQALRQKDMGIVIFSGFTRSEIEKMPLGMSILANVDVLIDGRFEVDRIAETGIRGSTNQKIHFLTDRYQAEQFEQRQFELLFKEDGEILVTGFPSSVWNETF